jgi:hypothetical protein
VALATFVEIKSTDQQLLLLEKQNEAAKIALETRRLQEVEVPQQGTNQYRAQTERNLADQNIASDKLLTTAKVNLMKATGTALKVNAWGNFIGNVASPLTAYLGRTQISTTTNMDQGSVSGSVSGGNLSNTTSVSNTAAGGAGGQGGIGGSSSASSTGGNVVGSGNSKSTGGNINDSGNASSSASASPVVNATGGSSAVLGSGNSKSSSNPTTTVANVGNSPTSVSNTANANPVVTASPVVTANPTATANPSQSQSTVASPVQTTTANPTATTGDQSQSQSQTIPPSS